MKKRLTMVMAVVCCMAMLVGSLAWFTDRADASAGATAGNINLVWQDTSDSGYGTEDQDNTKAAVWGTNAEPGTIASDIINPGDKFDMGYKLTNTGSKSIDVKQQMIVTSSQPMTAGAEEYQLKVGTVGNEDYLVLTPNVSADKLTITYELPQIVLTGTQENDTAADGIEGEDAIDGATGIDYDFYLEFAKTAKNLFMDSTVRVDLDIQAKQHRNTDTNDWIEWASYKTGVEQIG